MNQISEMQEVLDGYYNKLVELGVITPPKTAEQIAMERTAEQTEMIKTLFEAISSLKDEISEMKGAEANDRRNTENPADKKNRKIFGKKRDGATSGDSGGEEAATATAELT